LALFLPFWSPTSRVSFFGTIPLFFPSLLFQPNCSPERGRDPPPRFGCTLPPTTKTPPFQYHLLAPPSSLQRRADLPTPFRLLRHHPLLRGSEPIKILPYSLDFPQTLLLPTYPYDKSLPPFRRVFANHVEDPPPNLLHKKKLPPPPYPFVNTYSPPPYALSLSFFFASDGGLFFIALFASVFFSSAPETFSLARFWDFVLFPLFPVLSSNSPFFFPGSLRRIFMFFLLLPYGFFDLCHRDPAIVFWPSPIFLSSCRFGGFSAL